MPAGSGAEAGPEAVMVGVEPAGRWQGADAVPDRPHPRAGRRAAASSSRARSAGPWPGRQGGGRKAEPPSGSAGSRRPRASWPATVLPFTDLVTGWTCCRVRAARAPTRAALVLPRRREVGAGKTVRATVETVAVAGGRDRSDPAVPGAGRRHRPADMVLQLDPQPGPRLPGLEEAAAEVVQGLPVEALGRKPDALERALADVGRRRPEARPARLLPGGSGRRVPARARHLRGALAQARLTPRPAALSCKGPRPGSVQRASDRSAHRR